MTDDSGSAVVISGHLALADNFVPVADFGSADVVRDNLEREALNEENITRLVKLSGLTIRHRYLLVQFSSYILFLGYLH